ncbi:MAG: large conductance mechanosensitive channel protein MscL [Tissierellia bacterium]|nr:large conductance mechanosensitive channel protein MscL [Tissierellia bacterium]
MLKEFREFAVKGNVIDMAVGVVIGGAFGKIVTSLVNDLIMPLVGLLVGGLDFSNLFLQLIDDGNTYATIEAAAEAGIPTLNYGLFISSVVDFLIIAFSIFIAIKSLNKLKRKEELVEVVEEAPTTKTCPYCKTEISIAATRCPNCTSQLEEVIEV